ncbi:putative bifunctional P-450/NADPH-P450 reductase 2 [Shimia sp. SK013]|uniref:cytochrome P450 n=1 Tax=Shimia sp. SK013 TaxID=1389006 RepID=UPI0006B49D4D|nr:cytochrome P450 [Shimia sp. SK013]KPA23126.1 putative bifunctional P-450/NADPH-P450 reductase 2 [Shimia sp. SK013]
MTNLSMKPVPGLLLASHEIPTAPPALKAILQPDQYWPARILSDDIVQVHARGKKVVHVMQPDLATGILADDSGMFAKHGLYRKIAGGESGPQSMIALEGKQAWAAKTTFGALLAQRQSFKHVPMIQDVTRRLSRELAEGGAGETNISALLSAITFEIIWRVMFDPESTEAPLPDFVRSNIAEIFQARMAADHLRVTALISDTAVRSLELTKNCPHMRSEFIARGNETLSPDVLLDNIRLMLSAGHKTSASAVAWTLWLLSREPEATGKARSEIATTDLSDPKSFVRLDYTMAALREAMRLLPPAVMTVRQARQHTTLGALDVARGTPVIVNFYAMHRHQKLWSDPDIFRPSRFLVPQSEEIITGAYRPFSAGAHVCLGTKFAELESVVILSEMLTRFEFSPGKDAPKPIYSFTLHAWDGVPLTARARKRAETT